MDDESDFKKARGFLLTYSALVLALWYFGADLTQFKLMGNEIKLQHRTESIWLVLAVLNLYFWFRCYQRVPPLGLYFDKTMNELYDSALIWSALLWRRRALNKEVQANFAKNYASEGSIQMDDPYGKVTAREAIKRELQGRNATGLHEFSRASRTALVLHRTYSYTPPDGRTRNAAGTGTDEYNPSMWFTWPVKAFVFFRGAFVTPWFTDHIAPLLLGGISTFLALSKWYAINFCNEYHLFGAILCFS